MNTSAKCPRCEDGRIPCQYAYRPAQLGRAPEDCSPDESEVEEIGECEECGAKDWTEAEMEVIDREAAENYEPDYGPDEYGGDDPDD